MMGDYCQFCEEKGTKEKPLKTCSFVIFIENRAVDVIITYHSSCLLESDELILEFTN